MKKNIQNHAKHPRGRGFYKNSQRLLVFNYFRKSSIVDVSQDSEFASIAGNKLREKALSQMFDRLSNSLCSHYLICTTIHLRHLTGFRTRLCNFILQEA